MHTCPSCQQHLDDRDPTLAFCPNCGTSLPDPTHERAPDPGGPVVEQGGPVSQPDPGGSADPPDPLAGWDLRPPPASPPVPVADAAVVATGVVTGLVVGAAVAGAGHRGRGGLVGVLVGIGVAVGLRRPWELEAVDTTWLDHLEH